MTGHVIHLRTSIQASPDTIWEVLTDLPHTADILRSVRSAELLSEGEYGVGTTWREERTFFGHHGQEELHVVESDPPNRTLHETKLRHDRITTAYSIRANQHGGTDLLLTATLDPSERTPRERMAWNALGGHSYSATRKMLEQDLEDIRSEAEHRQGGEGRAREGTHRAG